MAIIKTVRQDGNGDYTSMAAAFAAMLASGLASSGSITDYYMMVDNSVYKETLTGYIPYSGTFYIVGSGTILDLTAGIRVSGEYLNPVTPNLYISDTLIIASGISNHTAIVPTGFGLGLFDVQIIRDKYGIYNSGGLFVTNGCESFAYPGYRPYFIRGSGYNLLNNVKLSNYGTGVYLSSVSINNSVIHNNNLGIKITQSGYLELNYSLFYNNNVGFFVPSGTVNVYKSTMNDPTYISGSYLAINESIFNNSIILSGVTTSGSYVKNTCLYPYPTLYSGVELTNIISSNPKFNNAAMGDYRLKFGDTVGSECVEVADSVLSGVNVRVSNTQLKLLDNRGVIRDDSFLNFIYTQGSTIALTDYNKEYKFAEFLDNHNNLLYQLVPTIEFTEFNVPTFPSFDLNVYGIDPYPWDWDVKTFRTTRIGYDESYLIPRSIIDVDKIITSKLGTLPATIFYEAISKSNFKIYDQIKYRGAAFDSYLSSPSESIIWLIDSNNQSLIKQNAFTGENLEVYPLLCSTSTKAFARPSGVIYVGVDGDYYKYIKTSDPNKEYRAYSENGDFQWLPINLNTKYDIRGVVCYNGNLFISASQYPLDIEDRNVIPTGSLAGRLLWYYDNDLFYNYLKMPGDENGPKISLLASGNSYPTDLTIYEDGSIFVADYYSPSGIFKYDLAYDYALIQSSYDNETRILLREYYPNVDL